MPYVATSARLKIERARQHLDSLQKETRGYIDSRPYRIEIERDREAGELHVVYYPGPAPDPMWSLIVGDFAHNLRSALDHVVHDLSSGAKLAEFPIYADIREFYKVSKGHPSRPVPGSGLYKLRAVADKRAWFFIEGVQPYNAGENARRAALWVLHELNNIDKHRTLHLCRRRMHGADIRVVGIAHKDFDIYLIQRPMEQRTVLSSYRSVVDIDTEVYVEGQLSLDVAFDRGGVPALAGGSVVEECGILLRQVTSIVDGIEAALA